MILGGSPHMVAEPPRFAQKISDKIMGIGLNLKRCESSIVTVAKNKITVMLSINIASMADKSIKVMNSGITSQLMPVLLPDVSPDRYQNSVMKMLLILSVSSTAVILCMPRSKKGDRKQCTNKRNDVSLHNFCHNKKKHCNKNNYCNSLCQHIYPFFLKLLLSYTLLLPIVTVLDSLFPSD